MTSKVMKTFISFIILLCFAAGDAVAQCAMCRSTLENNYSSGNPGIAAGINTGILYLLSMPYLAIMIIAYFWYKTTRNAQKLSQRGIQR